VSVSISGYLGYYSIIQSRAGAAELPRAPVVFNQFSLKE